MDDSCAVCAENLEWVAYGSCGHREVCSTCVVRLRFILGDRRCCICKTESSIIFVTKALGDYTRMINEFSTFPSDPREGRIGQFWYHDDTQAFFDDVDHYRMIKAMCRLSCSVCDKMEDHPKDGPRRRARFKSVEQLKGHLYHQHRLHMCSLCLEGRKVFICEQKLYSRAQLNQHISTGDSEVDGSESERGGFAGHPMCEFCRSPFYGDNELYTHMSTEHYTCHICQRQHPGQYEYYKNYDDLEIHFRRDHYLCEDESCLAKKFVVFQSEAELKRHNTIEHGGRMSRSQRNAALQIPTSFRYHRSDERDSRRGRARTFRREPRESGDNDLSVAIQASMETARTEGAQHEPSPSSTAQVSSDTAMTEDVDPLIQPFESLSTADTERSSRYLQALGHSSRNVPLGESSFPPLSSAPSGNGTQSNSGQNTMAAHIRRKTNKKANYSSSSPAWPAASRGTGQASSTYSSSSGPAWPAVGRGLGQSSSTSSSTSSPAWLAFGRGVVQPSGASTQLRSLKNVQTRNQTPATSFNSENGPVQGAGNANRISHSASAPNLSDKRLLEPSDSDFPPVSAVQMHKTPSNSQAPVKVEDVQTANKSLVENIRAALGHDEELYMTFKDISGKYRQGLIDSKTYLDYVRGYGLSHLVLDLARLCPDVQKQKELIEIHNASMRKEDWQENGWAMQSTRSKNNSTSKKDKGKAVNVEGSNSKDALADSFIDTVRKLQSSYKPSEEDGEVLWKDKDSYRASGGKSKVMVDEQPAGLSSATQPLPKRETQNEKPSGSSGLADGGSGSKQRKKTSKFHRARLGDGSMASLLDLKNSEPDSEPEPKDNSSEGDQNSNGVPVRGVWRKGGHKLFS